VGRERELGGLEKLHEEVSTSGRGRIALITGAAGIGKSRLLQELRRRLQARGAVIVEGRSREGARAYQPWLEVVEQTVRALGELGASRVAAQGAEVCDALKGRGGDLKSATVAVAAAEMRRVQLYERVAAFLADAARTLPLVVVIHDLHLADGATCALTAHLAQTRFGSPEIEGLDVPETERLRGLLVVTSRNDDAAWLEGVASERITLGGLDEGGIREFLQAPEVVQFFAEATGGRPRALEALLEARPADADELFKALVERLSPEAARLLRALSVYGRPAGPDVLRKIGNAVQDDIARAVAELVEAKLLSKVVVDGELRLGFTRSADEEATYRALDDAERTMLHAVVGRLLSERGDEADLVAAAEHLGRGGAGELAVDAALAAGERLELTFGYDRAIALYRRAHVLTTRDEARAELERRMVELKRLTGDYAGALDDAERLRRRTPEEPSAHRRIGQLHLLRDEFGKARAALSRARELAVAVSDDAELALITAASAEVCFLDGHHAEAKAECENGLAAISPDAGGEAARLRLEIRNTLGKVHLAEGRYAHAARLFAENLDEARAHGVPYEETRALINQGIAHLRLGDDVRAAASYQAALKVADASEDHRHRAFCLQNLGVLAHWKNDYATALRYFQEAVAAFKKIGHRGRLAWLALDLASLYLDLGDTGKAMAMAALTDRLADGNAAAAVAINREVAGGRIARASGDLDGARARFESARTLARRADNRERFAEATLHLSRLELDAGNLAQAMSLAAELDNGAEAGRAGTAQRTRARTLLLDGEISTARGDSGAARRSLLEGVEIFHRLGDLDGEWRSHFALGRAAEMSRDLAEAERRFRLAATVDGRLRERVPEELRAGFVADPTRRALDRALGQTTRIEPPPRPPVTAKLQIVRSDGATDPHASRYPRIIGRHPRLRQIFGLIDKIAPHDSLVLIRGESGTGKELVADALHGGSSRAGRALIKVNCGALVESLLLSELFGHERGAFTGAVQRKKGRFESADGGTIFLDEIGDISPKTQVALLRVLQERQFERVGSTTPIKVDVRILCATNRNLEEMVSRGEFREDLYYRLKGIQIELPSLRERIEDVPMLAESFLKRIAEERGTGGKHLAPEATELLCRYNWPGNVRELENVIRSVSLFADGEIIGVRDFADYTEIFREPAKNGRARVATPPAVAAVAPRSEAPATPGPVGDASAGAIWERLGSEGIGLRELQEKIEIECITRALNESRGNITKAAELLKMKRPRLSQLIKEYGIAPGACGE
jgi:DNA-binding NtrC family response regulator